MSRVIIEPILPLDTLKERVTSAEWSHANTFKSLTRRQEWLSWRAHLRANLHLWGISRDVEIEYNEVGAPYIVDSDIYISISHTSTHVAILLSSTPCAIDMELLNRNFARVEERYISPQESHLITTPELQAVAWCTKEAAYKYSAVKGCDLLQDIKILKIADDAIHIELLGKKITAQYMLDAKWAVVTINNQK